MLTERCKIEQAKAQSLQKICDMRFGVSTFESVLNGIKNFNSDMHNQINYSNEFNLSVQEDVIAPLQILSDKISNVLSQLSTQIKIAKNNYIQNVRLLENAKNKFHTSARNAELSKLYSEAHRINNSLSQETKMKNEIKAQEYLKIAKEDENSYISAIHNANESQDIYTETKKTYLNTIQLFEEEIGKSVKDALMKFLVFQVAYARNLQYDTNNKSTVYEQINVNKDINAYIYKHQTNDIPPYKFEFIPYVSDYNLENAKIKELSIPTDVVDGVKSFITTVFFNDSDRVENYIIDIKKTQSEINNMVKALYQGKDISPSIQNIIIKYIHNKKKRRIILETINTIRLKEKAVLTEQSYNSIGIVLKDYLNIIQNEQDYITCKILMNVATALYKNNPEPNKPRIFMQTYLHGHSLLKSFDFWKNIIQYNIIEEMFNQKGYNIYNNETYEEKKERIAKIAESVINIFLYNMISFGVSESLIKEVINEICGYYGLKEEFQKDLEKIVNEYSEKNQSN